MEDLHAFRGAARIFEWLAAFDLAEVAIGGGEGPAERVAGARVEVIAWPAFGVEPLLGRWFVAEEGRPGGPEAVVLGEALWRRRFGADPAVVGAAVRVDGRARTVVGVAPEGFGFPIHQEIWLPLRLAPAGTPRSESPSVFVFGRLAGGASTDMAQSELDSVDRRLASEFPATNAGLGVRVSTFTDGLIGAEIVAFQYAMLGIACLVLVVAAVNVANLLLALGAERTRDFALRATLGASRRQVFLQVVGESLALAAVGGLAGVVLARFGLAALTGTIEAAGIRPFFWFRLDLSPATLAGIIGLTLFATLVAGLPPAIQATRADVQQILKDQGRGGSSFRLSRFLRGLVIAEIALSMTVLGAAGVMLRSVSRLGARDYGLARDGVITAKLALPTERYATRADRDGYWNALLAELGQDARVDVAALASTLPVREFTRLPVEIEGFENPVESRRPTTSVAAISPAYFDVLGVDLVGGRSFASRDVESGEAVVIVNRAFVRRYFPEDSPVGRRVRLAWPEGGGGWQRIVGIAPDLWMDGPRDRRPDGLYVPLAQRDLAAARLLTRGRGGLEPVTRALRDAVTTLDSDVPLYELRSMDDLIARASFFYYFLPSLFLVFGGFSLLLAAVGLYAVVAFATRQRHLEMSIRVSLGATRGRIVALVLRQGAMQVVTGLTVGLLLAVGLNRALTRFLVAVSPHDPLALGAVVAALLAVCLASLLGPALRAGAVPPAAALRAE